MDRYIRDKLEADPQFRLLAATDPSAHLFPQEIRKRAKGVFLWVFLVVRSLLRGLTEDDDKLWQCSARGFETFQTISRHTSSA